MGETVSYTVEATIAQDSDGAQGVVIGDASLPEGMAIDMASIRAWLNDREITPVTADIEGNAFSIPFGDLRPGRPCASPTTPRQQTSGLRAPA